MSASVEPEHMISRRSFLATAALVPLGPVAARAAGLGWPQMTPIPETFFGMHMHHLNTPADPMAWPSVPVGSRRSWDAGPQETAWVTLNPADGVYDWRGLDALVALARAHDVDLVYTFGRTPRWASAKPAEDAAYGPGQAAPPASLDAWGGFVKAILARASAHIRYWEGWDEPDLTGFWSGDIPTMLEMQKIMYGVAKSYDPGLLVLSPPISGPTGLSWLASFLERGGGDHFDIAAFHNYAKPGGTAEETSSYMDEFRSLLASHGQSDKPVWVTEGSWGFTARQSVDQQVAFIPRYLLLQWSKGIERVYWYAWDNSQVGTLNVAMTAAPPAGPGEAARAYRITHDWMAGAVMMAPCRVDVGTRWTCGLTRPGGYEALVVWDTASDSTYTPDARFNRCRDLTGSVRPVSGPVAIGPKPILLEAFSKHATTNRT